MDSGQWVTAGGLLPSGATLQVPSHGQPPLQAGEGLGAKESGEEGAGGTPVAARYPKLVLGWP